MSSGFDLIYFPLKNSPEFTNWALSWLIIRKFLTIYTNIGDTACRTLSHGAHIMVREEKIMKDILEIIVAFLAVFGAYTLLDRFKLWLLYPRRVRMLIRAAVEPCTEEDLRKARAYYKALRAERKISPKRLIILPEDVIMEEEISHADIENHDDLKENDVNAVKQNSGERI